MKDYVAIFDIGSNAVRLVIYGGLGRAPVKIHNERNVCSLGAGLSATGHLNPEGVERAMESLRRFSGLVEALGVRHVHAVATAAVREATDGAEFIARVKKECGLAITLVDGAEEARLSALGVMMNGLGQDGLIGDYGGGSLELILTSKGVIKKRASLPIGSHRLHALQTRIQRTKLIDEALDSVDFLKDCEGLAFTALGGAWRSMARAHMHFTRYPLGVLDHYEISGKRATEFAALLSRQGAESLEKTAGLSKKRVRDVSVAAFAMERIFERLKPARLVFSGAGLREGMMFDLLPPATRRQDPLIAGCGAFAQRVSRYDDFKAFDALARWVAPLFAGEDIDRLVSSGCLLSDTAGFEHEDYQAERAFQQILFLPFYGASHSDRAFLAISQYVRYKGYLRKAARAQEAEEITRPAQQLLTEHQRELAVRLGLAQRAGYLLTGGALGLLKNAEFKVTPKTLTLKLGGKAALLNAGVIGEALEALASAMGKEAAVQG